MISTLTIKNYALIDDLEMKPSDQLTVITGETGAGKSIMLGALGLLLGNRADTRVLWEEGIKCHVEGKFDRLHKHVRDILERNELDVDDDLIIRREISPSGKSRAFINDSPTTLEVLKELAPYIVDIHSQYDTLQLPNKEYQLQILDDLASTDSVKTNYQIAFSNWQEKSNQYQNLLKKSKQRLQDLDYKNFVWKELQALPLDSIDQIALESELEIQENTEEIQNRLAQLISLLDGAEINILSQVGESMALTRNLQNLSGHFDSLYNRVNSIWLDLKDIRSEINAELEGLSNDPERLLYLRQTLDSLYRLQKKHQVNDIAGLVELRNQIGSELEDISTLDTQLEEAHLAEKSSFKKVLDIGKELSDIRKKCAQEHIHEIEKLIHQLGMENGTIQFHFQNIEPTPTGIDMVSILFSSNKGIAPREIGEIASGGELSRLMLAFKYLIATRTYMPTMIFDEIDTGVSGEVAIKMASMMKKMSENHQVIAITHLAQLAAAGHQHYYVFKDHSSDKSTSRIRLLDENEKVWQLARMIGGDNPSEAAAQSARELLSRSN